MFKNTINATQLKNYGEELSGLRGEEALQVLHRGSEVKVVITQDYFFKLLTLANLSRKPSQDLAVSATEEEMIEKSLELLRKHRQVEKE